MEKTILLVEDDSGYRDMLAVFFRERGYIVLTADDRCGGLKLVAAARPDVIITDNGMPNVDGIEMVRLLRTRQDCAGAFILVVSANEGGLMKEAISAGADSTLNKPVSCCSLVRVLDEVCRR